MIKIWKARLKALPDMVTIPRSITKPNQNILEIELHGSGDTSKEGCCSAIDAVVHHSEGTTTKLLTAKSIMSKRQTSIPRLELIDGHMVANSLDNVRNVLHQYPITSTYGWFNSTVALYYILNNNKEWKQFISNRVFKINQKKDFTRTHFPTKDNPAEIGNRGSTTLAPYKSLGRSSLPFETLKELVVETEVILNNRPLGYLENDIELPTLTPHMLIHGTNVSIPQNQIEEDPDYLTATLQKMLKIIKHCKDSVWKRWKCEYLRALRERHFCSNNKEIKLKIGDIVQIRSDHKNRGEWNLGKVTKLVKTDGILLGAKVLTRNNKIFERPIEFLYPMELHETTKQEEPYNGDNIEVLGHRINNVEKHEEPKANERTAKNKAIEKIKRIAKELSTDDIF